MEHNFSQMSGDQNLDEYKNKKPGGRVRTIEQPRHVTIIQDGGTQET